MQIDFAKVQYMDWNDLKYLIAVADKGSLQQAAKSLGVNHSTAWRRVQALEKSLDCQLFVADRQGYFLTEEGHKVLVHAQAVADHMDAIALKTTSNKAEVEGLIRVTGVGNYADTVIPKLCAEFRSLHPKVSFEIIDSIAPLSLEKREVDIAFRASITPPENVIARHLFDIRWHAFAHPELANGPMDLEALKQQVMIGYRDFNHPVSRWFDKHFKHSEISIRCNTVSAAAGAARAKLGFALLPYGNQNFVEPYELTKVYDYPDYQGGFWLLVHPQMRTNARIKAFWDFTLAKFKTNTLSAREMT